jgi:acetyl-CoA carboxylase carboxyl transferase subunit beta
MPWDGFSLRRKKEMPDGLFMKCSACGKMIYKKNVAEALNVCPECNFHFTLTSAERIELLLDDAKLEEIDAAMESADPLEFTSTKSYAEQLVKYKEVTGLNEAVVTGTGKMGGHPIVFGITDSRFLMGSMASVVGEKLSRALELATQLRQPIVIVSGSGGGARMHEGILSLMQMAKTSAAIARLHDAGGLFISVLTNPTMGGVAASFASLGDVIIAEPKALIGFAGPRTIWHTLKIELPEGFQTSEFLLEHGFLDMVVNRSDLKKEIVRVLDYLDAANSSRASGEAARESDATDETDKPDASNDEESRSNRSALESNSDQTKVKSAKD